MRLSNKSKLKGNPVWPVHIDDWATPTCGECGRELHNFLGVTEGMLEYKCECGCYSYSLVVLERER